MERAGKLNVLALESEKMVTVLWFYFDDDPVKHVTFKEYCYEKENNKVLFSGDGSVYLENVPICREKIRRID